MKQNELLDKMSGIIADFMNGVTTGNETAYEDAVTAIKNEWNIEPEQEACVRIALTHLELMALNCKKSFNLPGFVGLEINILMQVVIADWHALNTSTLSGEEINGN